MYYWYELIDSFFSQLNFFIVIHYVGAEIILDNFSGNHFSLAPITLPYAPTPF